MKLTLMSYNTQHCLNYVTREIDYDIMANTIQKCGADIIGLQEMFDLGETDEFTTQTKVLAEKLGFYYYFAEATKLEKGKYPYGNGLISRYPILSAETIGIPDPEVRTGTRYYETRCVLKAKIDVAGGLDVIVTHFGLNPDEQENAVKTVVANLEDEKCVLMGDFNVRPGNERIIPIREKLYDTAELFDAPKGSWPSDTPKGKIDYIFTTKDVEVLSADIPAIVSSDHRPHIATIAL